MSDSTPPDSSIRRVRICVAGMDSIGKSCLCMTYSAGSFPDDYVPMVFDSFTKTVMIAGSGPDDIEEEVAIEVLDSSYRCDYWEIFPQYTVDVDVFLIACSMVDPHSIEDKDREYELLGALKTAILGNDEIGPVSPNAVLYLVALKNDLAQDPQIIRELGERNETVLTRTDLMGFCEVVERELERKVRQVFVTASRPPRSRDGEGGEPIEPTGTSEPTEALDEMFLSIARDVLLGMPQKRSKPKCSVM